MKDPLAERIRMGDEQAFELLFRKYFARLCGFANKFLGDPDQAKDIVQEVFTRLWEGRQEIDPEDSLKSYIFKITQNMSLNRLRKAGIESRYTEIYKLVYVEYHEFSAYESLLAKELEENIAKVVSGLPPECRKIFILNRSEGLKYREIAEKLNISEKTVEAQMSKAFKIMRLELKDYLSLLLIALAFSGR